MMSLKAWIKRTFFRAAETDPCIAYDQWAADYDEQPNNLMLALDAELFDQFLTNTSLHKKVVVDVGCGTGRHWEKINTQEPARLIGFDVSKGMLDVLKKKFNA